MNQDLDQNSEVLLDNSASPDRGGHLDLRVVRHRDRLHLIPACSYCGRLIFPLDAGILTAVYDSESRTYGPVRAYHGETCDVTRFSVSGKDSGWWPMDDVIKRDQRDIITHYMDDNGLVLDGVPPPARCKCALCRLCSAKRKKPARRCSKQK